MKTKNLFLVTMVALFGVVFESSGQSGIIGTTVYLQSPPPSPTSINSVHVGQFAGASSNPSSLPVADQGMNCFIGFGSARYITTGSSNVFLGYQSALSNTTGGWNTFVGKETGYNNSTGIANTFIGALAGSGVTTGRSNTLIGSSDLTGGSGIITGSYNTILGRCIVGDVSNTIAISDGNNHIGYYVNNAWNAGIGTQTPNNKLEIKNNATPNSSGLRFTNLTSISPAVANPSSPNPKVLTVNATGDVILVNDVVGTGTGGGITNACAVGNYITKTNGTTGNLICSSIYDDGAGHVGFGYGSTPNTAFNVSINGTMSTGVGPYNTSDRKFKKDIKPIEDALNKIMTLEGKTYNWRKDEFKEKNFRDELQYGLIAQEVQKVIPSLVIQSENGDLAMNYIGLIPVLIEAIKEQQTQINDLKSQIADNFKAQNQDLITLTNTKIINVSPNPSNDIISVSFNVEKSVQTAKLQVHDLNGNVISSLNINDRENNITRTLQKDNFGKGIYIVSLLINGKSIDSKKIIFN
jgi:trimeric autotransporter adhesin